MLCSRFVPSLTLPPPRVHATRHCWTADGGVRAAHADGPQRAHEPARALRRYLKKVKRPLIMITKANTEPALNLVVGGWRGGGGGQVCLCCLSCALCVCITEARPCRALFFRPKGRGGVCPLPLPPPLRL